MILTESLSSTNLCCKYKVYSKGDPTHKLSILNKNLNKGSVYEISHYKYKIVSGRFK